MTSIVKKRQKLRGLQATSNSKIKFRKQPISFIIAENTGRILADFSENSHSEMLSELDLFSASAKNFIRDSIAAGGFERAVFLELNDGSTALISPALSPSAEVLLIFICSFKFSAVKALCTSGIMLSLLCVGDTAAAPISEASDIYTELSSLIGRVLKPFLKLSTARKTYDAAACARAAAALLDMQLTVHDLNASAELPKNADIGLYTFFILSSVAILKNTSAKTHVHMKLDTSCEALNVSVYHTSDEIQKKDANAAEYTAVRLGKLITHLLKITAERCSPIVITKNDGIMLSLSATKKPVPSIDKKAQSRQDAETDEKNEYVTAESLVLSIFSEEPSKKQEA